MRKTPCWRQQRQRLRQETAAKRKRGKPVLVHVETNTYSRMKQAEDRKLITKLLDLTPWKEK